MREIKAKWANLDDDSAWVRSLLCWYSDNISGDSVSVEIHPNVRKPDMHEPMLLVDDRLVNKMTGEVFAVFGKYCSSTLNFHCAPNKLCLTVRYTDLNLRQVTPHAFYFQLMCECLQLNRPNVCRVEMRVMNTNTFIEVGSEVRIEYSYSSLIHESEEWLFKVMFGDVVLCQALVCLHGKKHKKYDSTRKVHASQDFVNNAVQTRNLIDNAPVTCALFPFQHEINPVALPYSYLLLATLGVGEVSVSNSLFNLHILTHTRFFRTTHSLQTVHSIPNCKSTGSKNTFSFGAAPRFKYMMRRWTTTKEG